MRISDWSSDVCSSDLISMSILTADRAAFREALPHGGRLIGLDVGTKTIGIALCDAGWSIASPAHTVSRGKFSKDKIALAAFLEQQQVKGVVIGLARKSVVEGKSVSVRVDLGGRRIIKKKKK